MKISDIPIEIRKNLKRGVVIPAMPLALNPDRTIDKYRQKAVIRYYIDAGVGGIAVAVHTTQFEIRNKEYNLLERLLKLASETIDKYCEYRGKQIIKIVGICGRTKQALHEVEISKKLGFHAGLVSLGNFSNDDNDTLIQHCQKLAEMMPLFGFYLQPSVGGRMLSNAFWLKFCQIENVLGIKIAPFNRYQTFDVVRAVAEANREENIALYTGNDDNIVVDLLTRYKIITNTGLKSVGFAGGLLGHWSVWTKKAVELLEEIHSVVLNNQPIPPELLSHAQEITDANAVIFDAANNYAGCIPGIHEVLRRQGLFRGIWCLNPNEKLSPNQKSDIDRVYNSYPHLNDDEFVKANLKHWLDFPC
jgi:dihydrodipicolinate synthase/N-acetylneuraminate lyase